METGMTASDLLVLVREALNREEEIGYAESIADEENVLGVTAADGGEFFIEIKEG
jgi:hypothetical protein